MERLSTAQVESDFFRCADIGGQHVVDEAGGRFATACHLRGLPGTRIYLDGPLVFEEDLLISGDITFYGRNRFQQACITVWGQLTVSNATLHVKNCSNWKWEAQGMSGEEGEEAYSVTSGGCIAAGGLVVESSEISLSQCHAEEGAGFNIGLKGFVQKSGTIDISECHSNQYGGGMQIAGHPGHSFTQYDGDLTFRNCSAHNSHGGGLYLVTGSLMQKGGSIEFDSCTAHFGGGAYIHRAVRQDGGRMGFKRCKTFEYGDGGGLFVRLDDVTQVNGEMVFHSCSADSRGGGMYLSRGNLTQLAGGMMFKHCFVASRGAAVYVHEGNFMQKGGSMELDSCMSQSGGGGLALGQGSLIQSDGTIFAFACGTYDYVGGCLFLESGDVEQTGGALVLRKCSAKIAGSALAILKGNLNQLAGKMVFENGIQLGGGDGGCVTLEDGSVVQTGGSMLFTDCHGASWGHFGGLSVNGNLRQTDGQLLFYKCTAPGSGGAVGVFGDVIQENGYMEFHKCSSRETGGAMYISRGSLTQLNGNMAFQECATGHNLSRHTHEDLLDRPLLGGGALHLAGSSLTQRGGSMSFDGCSTEGNGAGILIINGNLVQTAGTMLLKECTAKTLAGGIGIQNGSFRQENGTLWISEASAGQAGGGLLVQDGSVEQLAGMLSFDGCSSDGVGGGLSVLSSEGHVKLHGKTFFQQCVAGMSGGALYATCPTKLSSPTIVVTTMLSQVSVAVRGVLTLDKISVASTLAIPFEVLARELVIAQPPNCSLVVDGCQFTATSLHVPPPLCPRGTGFTNLTKEGQSMIGCRKCPPGSMQLMAAESQACRPCPANAEICEPHRVKMLPGYMVSIRSSVNDLSPPRRCASPKACPGRFLPDQHLTMCADGYAGDGCLYCNRTTHAPADGQSLSCAECAVGTQEFAMELGYFVAKSFVIFTIAFLGGVAQEDGSETTTTSSILLNQMMAFSAASLLSVAAAAETATARADGTLGDMLKISRQVLAWSQADMGLTSFLCLVNFGQEPSLWTAHVLSSMPPALMILAFAMKDSKLAVAAGINCFIAGFAAQLGRFIVPVPAFDGAEDSSLLLPELPLGFSNTMGVLFFGGLILACFLAVGAGWSYTALSQKSPTPSHVTYLRGAYRSDRSTAEVERIVRRMLLRLLPVLLPVGAYPASQMGAAAVLLLFSLAFFAYLKPYQEMWLNYVELTLVAIALLMAIMANWLLVRDLEGAKGSAIDVFLLGTLASLGFLVGASLTLALVVFLFGERKPRELLEDL